VYCERLPDPRYLDPRLEALPHGLLWRVAPKGESVPDADWDAEVDLDALSKARRRLRAHRISGSRDGTWAWHRETYEDRLLTPILLARLRRVDPVLPSKPGEALEAYRRAADLAPPLLEDPRFRFNHSLALYLTDRLAEARTGFERLLEAGPGAELATMGRYYLGEIALAGRRPEEARRHFEAAIRSGGVAPEVMEHIRRRASGR
jgi:TolA-binding protein